MGIEGMAAVQSRIAAIEGRIAALGGGGRPPVALTERTPAASSNSKAASIAATTAVKSEKTTPAPAPEFSAELKAQIAKATPTTSTPSTGAGVLQGVPGTAEAFVSQLKKYLGVPYVWGGTNPAIGLDCSGLVQLAAREVGVNLPRVTWDQQNAGKEVSSLAEAKPGDLLITRGGAHIAVFLGDNQAIQAPRPGQNVEITSVANLGPIKTIRRVMPSASEAAATTSADAIAPSALNNSLNMSEVLGGNLAAAQALLGRSAINLGV